MRRAIPAFVHATLLSFGLLQAALAQEAPTPKAPGAEDLETVVVTGSHIATGAGQQIARPVDVISAATIEQLGPQKLVEALRREPAFTGAVSTAGAGPDSGGRSTVNLRGLGEKYTLVLVNGRRFNAVTPANLNDIPVGAVSGIEVLKDGSSSVYGSDAVAGVVNILLDTDFNGLEVASSYGNTFGHDATEIKGSLKFGVSGERGRLVTNVNYRDRNGTALSDMALGRVRNLSDIGGIDNNRYYTSPATVIVPADGPIRPGETLILDYNRFGVGEYSNDPNDYIAYDQHAYNESAFNVRERDQFTDRAPERQFSLFASGEYDLVPERATLFTEAIFSTGKLRNGYVTWGLDFYGDPVTDFGVGVPASNPYNPFGVDLLDVQYAVPEVGQYFEAFENTTYRLVNGLKGKLGTLSYEVGATYFRSQEIKRQQNLYSSAGIVAAVNRPGADAFNPFCNACNTPAQLAGIRVPNNELTSTATQKIYDARITGPLTSSEHFDLAFATGLEYRKEEWDYAVDPLSLLGGMYYIQETPDFQERSAKAVFGELSYNLDGLPAIHKLTMELSARYEDIGGVGDTTNPRLAFAWQPISEAFTLRASYGTSFNAPPINLLRAEQVLVNEVLDYPQPDGSIDTTPTDVLVGGNPDLQAETAESLNLGVILAPSFAPGLKFIVDYYDVYQKDVVVVPDAQAIANGTVPGEVDFSGVRPRIVAVATNIAGRKIKGFDFTADYSHQTGSAGTWGAQLGGSYMTEFKSNDGPGYVSWLGTIGQVGDSFGDFGALPRFRGRAGVSWDDDSGLGAELSANYVGHFADGDGVVRDVKEFLTLDLNVEYDFKNLLPGLSSQFGLLNILDEEPPFVNWERGGKRYDSSTASSQGRFAFVSLKYNF